MQLPCPIQFFDLLTKCPSPWLHYGYCTPCLEDSRLTGTDILNHIIHCETLFKRCQDNKLASHIELYQRTEAKIAGKILSADSPPWICTPLLRTPSSEFHRHQIQILDMQMTHFINRRIYKFFQSYTHIYLFICYFHTAGNQSTDTLMKLGPAATSPQPRRTIGGWVCKLWLWYFPSLCVTTVLNKKIF